MVSQISAAQPTLIGLVRAGDESGVGSWLRSHGKNDSRTPQEIKQALKYYVKKEDAQPDQIFKSLCDYCKWARWHDLLADWGE